ncbi:MAG: transcriptional regulator, partial [Acetobacteraceae bacterium]|nr:transcriptional regulator [Acetobacteraceae bacterium]
MARRIAAYDWAATPLGAIGTWPAPLRNVVSLVLNAHFPICLAWGRELLSIYNDAYRPILGIKPEALGQPFPEVWAEVWAEIGPIAE